jgi:phage/plasmid-like protein (TIGR03299 family)
MSYSEGMIADRHSSPFAAILELYRQHEKEKTMSHEVETMAWAHEVPWHGLGVQVAGDLSPQEMMRAAGLDWTVSLRPLQTEPTEIHKDSVKIPSLCALVRDTDGKVLTTAGRNWRPIQNADTFDFFRRFCDAGGATMETAGSLHGGEVVWGLARLGEDFSLPGHDEVRGYLLMMSPHRCGQAALARVTAVRVVCANTMAMATRGTARIEQRWAHTRVFEPAVAAATLGMAREEMRQFEANCRRLKALRMTTEEVVAILAPSFQRDETPPEQLVAEPDSMSRTMRQLMEAYTDAPGADPGTGWGALNAVTYYLDHSRGRSRDQRLQSSWAGRAAARRTEVMDRLLELAD